MSIPHCVIELAKAHDQTVEVRVRAGDGKNGAIAVRLTADAAAGAESIAIAGDHPAFASGDKLILGDNVVVSCGATCAAGAVTMTVSALDGPLKSGDVLEKLQDLTSYDLALEVLERGGDATPVIAKATGSGITLATQTGADRGKAQVAFLAADTASLSPRTYAGFLRRSNSGSARPLMTADVKIVEAGFLS